MAVSCVADNPGYSLAGDAMPRKTASSTRPNAAVPAPARRHHALPGPWPRLCLALMLALGACGGGGSGSTSGAGSGPAADLGAGSATTTVGVPGSAELTAQLIADAGLSADVALAAAATTTVQATGDAQPATSAGAALGAADLALLVAEGDPTSEAIARAYQAARGVPEANIIRLPVSPGSDAIGAADFAVLKQLLDARLPANIQAMLVTWTQPSRVQGACAMGLTSALAFGYDARWCGGCGRTLASPYFNSASRRPWSDHRLRPSMMLGASTLADAQALIARGVAADGQMQRSGASAVSGSGWLLRTSDGARSVRYPDFMLLAATPVAGVTVHYLDAATDPAANAQAVTQQGDVMFYFTGLAKVPQLASNHYLPGAVADHLTSFAGLLPAANGQMPATDWLAAGATGSYGTVEEPCNYPEKFSRASVLVGHYQRGDTLIEAYWKSVQWPGQGLFVGEPLARPWARL